MFSKTYDDSSSPHTDFAAVMTCSHADENCPFIASASHRYHLPFVDPKSSDGSSHQEAAYLAVNEKIAAEVGYIFAAVKEIIS
jgi:arsenate reductase